MSEKHLSASGASVAISEHANDERVQKTQWTVKGLDQKTIEISRRAAQKRGMKIGAWVSEALVAAASCDLEDGHSNALESQKEVWERLHALEKRIVQDLEKIKDASAETERDVRIIQRRLIDTLGVSNR